MGRRRTHSGEISPRSNTITPQPPPWISRSAHFKACSMRFLSLGALHLAQSNREKFTPVLKAEPGSKAFPASIKAQCSPWEVAEARKECIRVVRPEETGPEISVMEPLGKP